MLTSDQITYLRKLAGKWSKSTLVTIEQDSVLVPEVRKAILDNFNEYGREIERLLLETQKSTL